MQTEHGASSHTASEGQPSKPPLRVHHSGAGSVSQSPSAAARQAGKCSSALADTRKDVQTLDTDRHGWQQDGPLTHTMAMVVMSCNYTTSCFRTPKISQTRLGTPPVRALVARDAACRSCSTERVYTRQARATSQRTAVARPPHRGWVCLPVTQRSSTPGG